MQFFKFLFPPSRCVHLSFEVIFICDLYFNISYIEDGTFYTRRWWDVRLDVVRQFKTELVRLVQRLVFERKYFYSRDRYYYYLT